MRAVHETGARVTHEVKNLLQSLDSLCYLMETSDDGDAAGLQHLVRRQLPQIGRRLRQTLAKLQPQATDSESPPAQEDEMAAADWWEALQQRFSHERVRYVPTQFDPDARLPVGLFDSVADHGATLLAVTHDHELLPRFDRVVDFADFQPDSQPDAKGGEAA